MITSSGISVLNGAFVIDRRSQGGNKSVVNRGRFLGRYKGQIRDAVERAIRNRSITDIEKGEKISIPVKDIKEPVFGHARDGVWDTVHPGNKEYKRGDRVTRPKSGGGSGKGKAGNSDAVTEDDFIFELTREEFMNIFFEGLELPNLVKTQLTNISEFKNQRAGYKMSGTPTNIHLLRSLRGALGRRVAQGALRSKKRLKVAEQELRELEELVGTGFCNNDLICALREEIRKLRIKLMKTPFIDLFDIRYSNRIKVPKPTTQAVMFCIMDVSGSMDQEKKDMAKRFFILLYLFLERAYGKDKVKVVFIRHHTQATEVDEAEFFNSRESGGTVVSSALHLLQKIMAERYSSADWNVYVAQASDGDNWDNDSVTCRNLLIEQIMPIVQYYAYVELTDGKPQNLWEQYLEVSGQCEYFAMQKIETLEDIYPVFRKLFQPKGVAA
jgi:uncharacterized sporulation protein YeaH/YhbH (DUF444 family)